MFLSVYVVPPSLEAREEFKAFGDQGIIFIIAIAVRLLLSWVRLFH